MVEGIISKKSESNTIDKNTMLEIFHHLHKHAEISWEEKNTTAYIQSKLEKAGCVVKTIPNSTGVIGDIGNFDGNHPVIAFRADMDALFQEVDGKKQANHSCGHDAHMTIVLGLLDQIKNDEKIKSRVGVRLIFQPAEEVGTGAKKMFENGAVNGVDYLFGVHLRPIQELKNGYASSVISHGSSHTLEFELHGEEAHAARPHLTDNAIEIGMNLLQTLHTYYFDPNIAHSIKATRFIAGGKSSNIIPGDVSIALDIRAQTNELMSLIMQRTHAALKNLETLYQVKVAITKDRNGVAAERSPEAECIAAKAIATILGEKYLVKELTTPGGDDFHYYRYHQPELKATMIGVGCDLAPGLHHPYMQFNQEAIFTGINIMKEILNDFAKTE